VDLLYNKLYNRTRNKSTTNSKAVYKSATFHQFYRLLCNKSTANTQLMEQVQFDLEGRHKNKQKPATVRPLFINTLFRTTRVHWYFSGLLGQSSLLAVHRLSFLWTTLSSNEQFIAVICCHLAKLALQLVVCIYKSHLLQTNPHDALCHAHSVVHNGGRSVWHNGDSRRSNEVDTCDGRWAVAEFL